MGTGFRNVALSDNFDLVWTGEIRGAISSDPEPDMRRLPSAYGAGSTAIRQAPVSFVRFLWSDRPTERGYILHEHYLVLTMSEFKKTNFNFRPILDYLWALYPDNVFPSRSEIGLLPATIEVEVPHEPLRLQQLWHRLKHQVTPNQVQALLHGLFEATAIPLMIEGFPRSVDVAQSELFALDTAELITLLLPPVLRPGLTFATRLSAPERSNVRLRFDASGTGLLRLHWTQATITRAGTAKTTDVDDFYYPEEIVKLWWSQDFERLVEFVNNYQLGKWIQKLTLAHPSLCATLMEQWKEISEDYFFESRLRQGRISGTQILQRLASRRSTPTETATLLGALTREMLKTGDTKDAMVMKEHLTHCDIHHYVTIVRSYLDTHYDYTYTVFATLSQQIPLFVLDNYLRDLLISVVEALVKGKAAKNHSPNALRLFLNLWPHFPQNGQASKSMLLEGLWDAVEDEPTIRSLVAFLFTEVATLGEYKVLSDSTRVYPIGLRQTGRLLAAITLPSGDTAISLLVESIKKEWSEDPVLFWNTLPHVLNLNFSAESLMELTAAIRHYLPDKYETPELYRKAESLLRQLKIKLTTFPSTVQVRDALDQIDLLMGLDSAHLKALLRELPLTGPTSGWFGKLREFVNRNPANLDGHIREILENSQWRMWSVQEQWRGAFEMTRMLYPQNASQSSFDACMTLLEQSPRIGETSDILQLFEWIQQSNHSALETYKRTIVLQAFRIVLQLHDTISTEQEKRIARIVLAPPERVSDTAWFYIMDEGLISLNLVDRVRLFQTLNRAKPYSLSRRASSWMEKLGVGIHVEWVKLGQPQNFEPSNHLLNWNLDPAWSRQPIVDEARRILRERSTMLISILLKWNSWFAQQRPLAWLLDSNEGKELFLHIAGTLAAGSPTNEFFQLYQALPSGRHKAEIVRQYAGLLTSPDSVRAFLKWYSVEESRRSYLTHGLRIGTKTYFPELDRLLEVLGNYQVSSSVVPNLVGVMNEIKWDTSLFLDFLKCLLALKNPKLISVKTFDLLKRVSEDDRNAARPAIRALLALLVTDVTYFNQWPVGTRLFLLKLASEEDYQLLQVPLIVQLILERQKWIPSMLDRNAGSQPSEASLNKLVESLITYEKTAQLSLENRITYLEQIAKHDIPELRDRFPRFVKLEHNLKQAKEALTTAKLKGNPKDLSIEVLINEFAEHPNAWKQNLPREIRSAWTTNRDIGFPTLISTLGDYIQKTGSIQPLEILEAMLQSRERHDASMSHMISSACAVLTIKMFLDKQKGPHPYAHYGPPSGMASTDTKVLLLIALIACIIGLIWGYIFFELELNVFLGAMVAALVLGGGGWIAIQQRLKSNAIKSKLRHLWVRSTEKLYDESYQKRFTFPTVDSSLKLFKAAIQSYNALGFSPRELSFFGRLVFANAFSIQDSAQSLHVLREFDIRYADFIKMHYWHRFQLRREYQYIIRKTGQDVIDLRIVDIRTRDSRVAYLHIPKAGRGAPLPSQNRLKYAGFVIGALSLVFLVLLIFIRENERFQPPGEGEASGAIISTQTVEPPLGLEPIGLAASRTAVAATIAAKSTLTGQSPQASVTASISVLTVTATVSEKVTPTASELTPISTATTAIPQRLTVDEVQRTFQNPPFQFEFAPRQTDQSGWSIIGTAPSNLISIILIGKEEELVSVSISTIYVVEREPIDLLNAYTLEYFITRYASSDVLNWYRRRITTIRGGGSALTHDKFIDLAMDQTVKLHSGSNGVRLTILLEVPNPN